MAAHVGFFLGGGFLVLVGGVILRWPESFASFNATMSRGKATINPDPDPPALVQLGYRLLGGTAILLGLGIMVLPFFAF